jgi:allantoicase
VPETPLQPHARHRFSDLAQHTPTTHARLNIYPDGGIARMRLFGMPEPA